MQVTQEQWELDVENTRKELKAYEMFVAGYEILVELPENDETKRRLDYFYLGNNRQRVAACRRFLDELIEFGKEMFGVDASEGSL